MLSHRECYFSLRRLLYLCPSVMPFFLSLLPNTVNKGMVPLRTSFHAQLLQKLGYIHHRICCRNVPSVCFLWHACKDKEYKPEVITFESQAFSCTSSISFIHRKLKFWLQAIKNEKRKHL